MKRKIGILGGTFNPVHIGHLVLAQAALSQLSLHKVFFVPTHLPPHKDTYLINAQHRLHMVREAIKGNNSFGVLDWEMRRGGISYTIETVRSLLKRFPKDRFFLIIGSDIANYFHTWKEHKEIQKCVRVAVALRQDFPLQRKHSFLTVSLPHIGITSSLVREYIQQKRSLRYIVPDAVGRYIVQKKLYQKKK